MMFGLTAAMTFYEVLPTNEPYSDGRPLGFWLRRLPLTLPAAAGDYVERRIRPTNSDADEKTYCAIRRIGTNALPYLLNRIGAEDPGWIAAWKEAFFQRILPDADSVRWQAVTAVGILGTNASCMLRQLEALRNGQNISAACAASVAILEFNLRSRDSN